MEGIEFHRSEVSNDFEEERSIDNVPEEVLNEVIELKQLDSGFESITLLAANNTNGGYITDLFVHAKNVYGGTPWVAHEWSNHWENYANYAVTGAFEGYENHCGPTAITNIIKMYGNKYNNRSIKQSSNTSVYGKVIEANNENWLPYYWNTNFWFFGGTFNAFADGLIKDSFDKFGVTVYTHGRYDASYANIKNALGPNSKNRLTFIMLNGDDPYGAHAVVGYAYTRLYSSSLYAYKSYVKICDGHYSSARYVDMATMASDKYWEVRF